MDKQPNPRHRNLADKYRPTKLESLVGADHLINPIKEMVTSKMLPNCVLLYGPSGSGKTTIARMLMRYFNCKTHDACGKCPSCKELNAGPVADLSENNAAEARGIDDVRRLIAASQYRPTYRARIMLLDECFPADTMIEYAPGELATIKDIVENPLAYPTVASWNVESGRLEQKTITARAHTGKRRLIRVHLSDGSCQDCTPNHQWWSVTRGAMVRADELQPNEQLLSLAEVGL